MRASLWAVAFSVAACTGSSNYWRVYTPASGTAHGSKADVVQHAVVAITDAGRELESSDATTGIALSKWFSGDGFGGDDARFRVRVTVDDGGAYKVVALCQRKGATGGAWNDCEDESRPQFVIDLVGKVDAALK